MQFSGISDEAGASIDVQIKAHLELGWKYIELRSIEGVNLTDVEESKFDEIFGKLADAGLQVSCFAAQIANWARPISTPFEVDMEELKRAIPRMHRMGTKFIRIMSYPNDKDSPWEESSWKTEVVKRMKQLCRVAEDGDVMLLHENCSGWGGENNSNNLQLLQEINSPAFRQLFDTGNPIAHGHNSWDWYQAVKDQIEYVHIKDGVATEDGCKFTYCGEGEGQTKRILESLDMSGYNGVISIEPHLGMIISDGKTEIDPEKLYRAYIKYGRKLMNLIEDVKNAK